MLNVDDDTGATELVMDPSNNKVLYAATYQRRRATWGFNGGGSGSAMWKSSDAGRTWTKLTNGVPSGPLGRIGMDVYRANPNISTRIEHEKESGTYRSDDAGLTWRKMSNVNPRPMYFSQIRIDPTNDLRVYVLGVQLHISDDGGKTFIENGTMHPDHHAMWINPKNSNHIIDGNDGGIGISWDKGRRGKGSTTWISASSTTSPTTWRRPTTCAAACRTTTPGAGRRRCAAAPASPTTSGSRFTAATASRRRSIRRTAHLRRVAGRQHLAHRQDQQRAQVDSPAAGARRGGAALELEYADPDVAARSGDDLCRRQQGVQVDRSRPVVDGDQPRPDEATDRETLPLMGVTGKEIHHRQERRRAVAGNIVQLVESPKHAGVLYAGTDDGKVHMTRDGGKTWTDITSRFKGVPANAYVSRLTASAHDVNVVYATFDNHRADDYGTFIYASVDGGNNFRSIGEGIPKGHTITAMAEDPETRACSTRIGVRVVRQPRSRRPLDASSRICRPCRSTRS